MLVVLLCGAACKGGNYPDSGDDEPQVDVLREIRIEAQADILVDSLTVKIVSLPSDLAVRYSLDGSEPTLGSPAYSTALNLTAGALIRARAFDGERPATAIVEREIRKVVPRQALSFFRAPEAGLRASVYLGRWVSTEELGEAQASFTEILNAPGVPEQARLERCTILLEGFLWCEESGVQCFEVSADGNVRFLVGGELIVDAAGSASGETQAGCAALAAGWHPLRLEWLKPEGEAALLIECGTLDGVLGAPEEQRLAH